MGLTVLSLLALAWGAAGPAVGDGAAAIAEGDAAYARRAEGAQGEIADPTIVESALLAYRRALAVDPDSVEARFKLMRALHFRASFCGAPREEKLRLLREARSLGDEGVARTEKRIGKLRGMARLDALRRIPEAGRVYLWTAVAWGEWALAGGKLAAATQGAARRVRDLAQTVVDLDPEAEEAGGLRALGRLHDQSPRIPFITGWISRKAAIVYLRRAVAIAPQNLVNREFLGEALLDHDSSGKEEGRRLLEACAAAEPRPVVLVEERYYAAVARTRLARDR